MISERELQKSENTPNERKFTFGEFSFEAGEKILWRDGAPVGLPPKTCELLAVFIENAGQILTKEELMNLVWKDTFVEEANLSHHIAVLRKSLGEEKNGKKFVQTIPRKGYRFVAPVSEVSTDTLEITVSEKTVTESIEEVEIEPNNVRQVLPETPEIAHGGSRRSFRAVAIGAGVLALAAVVVFFAWKNLFSSQSPPMEIKRMTADLDVRHAAISPDGASLVYLQNENGNFSLWRKSVVTGETSQLLAPSVVKKGLYMLRFSPDGKWIYYIANTGASDGILRIPSGGGVPQTIVAKTWTDFAISPDSKQIAFVNDWELRLVELETGAERSLGAPSAAARTRFAAMISHSLAWSPDGGRIVLPAFQTNESSGAIENLLIETDVQTGAQKLIPTPKDFAVENIEWMPDGKALIVTRAVNAALPMQIWRVSYPDAKEIRQISPPGLSFSRIRLSADGKSLSAIQRVGSYNLWLASTGNFTERRQISTGASSFHGQHGLAYLPNRRIVYTSTQSGNLDLWITDETGGNRRQLTVNAGSYNALPQVTADGRYIIFVSDRSGSRQIWRMDADGLNPVQLTTNLKDDYFELAPDNRIYLFELFPETKERRFYKISVENGAREELDNNLYTAFPNVSPDGKWFLSPTKNAQTSNLIETATGTAVRQIKHEGGYEKWMRDASAIVSLTARGQKMTRIPIDGGEAQIIADFSPNFIAEFAFSPDGDKTVLSLGNVSWEAVLIQNF